MSEASFGMSNRNRARLVIAAACMVVLQIGLIGYMTWARAAILRDGAEVLLQTRAVDPRDFLRGDYVTLNYDISNVPRALVTGPKPSEGETVTLSVLLKRQEDGAFGIVGATFGDPPPATDGEVMMRTLPFRYTDYLNASDFRVSYGIERYYVPEGEGKALEDLRNEGKLQVAVRVSSDGKPQIRALYNDGKPAYEEPLY
ncbi:GDYXXLXY domain-containing protein [Rhizobium sp. PAMB 3182]